jgi:serine/threonine protein kinase
MMTGKIPYKDYSTAQIIGMVGNDDTHHISIPEYPNKTLLAIFMRCTERDPANRPSFKEIVKEV